MKFFNLFTLIFIIIFYLGNPNVQACQYWYVKSKTKNSLYNQIDNFNILDVSYSKLLISDTSKLSDISNKISPTNSISKEHSKYFNKNRARAINNYINLQKEYQRSLSDLLYICRKKPQFDGILIKLNFDDNSAKVSDPEKPKNYGIKPFDTTLSKTYQLLKNVTTNISSTNKNMLKEYGKMTDSILNQNKFNTDKLLMKNWEIQLLQAYQHFIIVQTELENSQDEIKNLFRTSYKRHLKRKKQSK